MKMNCKKHLTLSIAMLFTMLVLLCTMANAAPLRDIPQKIVQPSGEVIECYASGDEYFNWLHDKNGNIIIQDKKTGNYSYAKYVDGKILPSTNYISKTSSKILNTKGLKNQTVKRENIEISQNQLDEIGFSNRPDSNISIQNAPTDGVINNIVMYIRFSDEAEFTSQKITYENMFNDNTDGSNSMVN